MPLESKCLLVIVLTINIFCGETARKNMCAKIPEPVLGEILGPAFNSRYMSIEQPKEIETDLTTDAKSYKRTPSSAPSFYVDDHFSQEISDEPAWKTNHIARKKITEESMEEMAREKRAVKHLKQWQCESIIRWMDLGQDYFPRYLRSVECTTKTCWYDMMKCKPRSFTVKILRRKRDRCVSTDTTKFGSVGLPRELRELWIWEERAVNFCCDCVF